MRTIHLPQTTAIKYLQVWLVLCPQSREHTNRQVFFKFNPVPTSYWRTQRLLWPCYSSNLMQRPHLASHCVRSYKHTQNCLFSIVLNVIFFPPLSLFLAILSTSSRRPQKRVAERTTDCSKVVAIVSQPPCAGNSFAFPPPNISPPNNGVLLWVCHIIEGMQDDQEPGPTQDMHTCGLHSRDTQLSFGNTNRQLPILH